MLTSEQYSKLIELVKDLVKKDLYLKNDLRGVPHGPTSYLDQRDLHIIKQKLTACYMIIAGLRGRQHLSGNTPDKVVARLKNIEMNLIHSLK